MDRMTKIPLARLLPALLLAVGCWGNCAAQHDAALYARLIQSKKEARSLQQQWQSSLALSDYHREQAVLKSYRSSIDSAYGYLETANRLALALKSDQAQGLTFIAQAKMLDYQLKYEEAIGYAEKAIAIFEKRRDRKNLALAYRALYNSYRYTHTTEEALALAEKMLAVSLDSGDDAIIGKAYENLAESTSLMRDYDRTFPLLDKARHHYEKAKVVDQKSLYAFYGMLYTSMANHAKALAANLKAVEIIETNNIRDYANVTVYITVGNMYRDMQRFDEALAYYEKAYANLEYYDLPRFHVILDRFLANTYIKNGQFADAERYLRLSEKWYAEVDEAYKDYALLSILDGYTDLGKLQSAERYIPDATRRLDSPDPNKSSYSSLSFALAKYYFATKHFTEARKRAASAVRNLENTPARYKLYEAYKMLYQIDSLSGDFRSAMKNYNSANVCKDSVNSLAKAYQLAELEVKYDLAKKNNDNLFLKRQGELQKASLVKTQILRNISLCGSLLLAGVVFFIYRKFRMTQRLRKMLALNNLELEETLEEKEVLLEEKEWLLKEIHHRVKNNLQIVMSLLNSQSHFLEDEVAKKAIQNSQHRIHTMSLIHKKLYQSENISRINMSVYFWELVEYYKIAFDVDSRIRFHLEVSPVELEPSQAVPLGLILNEIVNNALKHAFPCNSTGNVRIFLAQRDDHFIELCVVDDGIGCPNVDLHDSLSLGMKLIHGFTKDLSGTLTFASEKGMEVRVSFALFPESRKMSGEIPQQALP